MAEPSSTDFLTLLRKSGLLETSQFDAAQQIARKLQSTETAGHAGAPAAAIAEELVQAGLVTRWQSSQLLKGQTGFILQQYCLLAPVGKGGMGHVFKARDSKSGAIVAIKVMSRKLMNNQTLVNRFRREIRASSLLNSPHIVRTLDAGRVGKVDFMVMEYVNGDQVDQIAARLPMMPVAMACDIVRQAAIGLQHAHENKMVHRDLKPGNLIVHWSEDGTGTVRVMDMGLVRLAAEADERTSVTRAGQVMGTPDYMSPEQGWDTATVDIRSDIYSLGCTLFRLLTGKVPFPGDNPLQVLMARCSRDAPSVRSLRADVPEPVDAIVRRMTVRDPALRYQTPEELIQGLAPFSAPLNVPALRKALREAGEDDAILLEVANEADSGDVQDVGYQQFLREMDSGAAVDMMISTAGAQSSSSSTTLVGIPQTQRSMQATRSVPGQKKKTGSNSRTAVYIALASGVTMIGLLILFIAVNSGNSPSSSPEVVAQVLPAEVIPKITLRAPSPVKVMAGSVLEFLPQLDSMPPTDLNKGEMIFQAGKGIPAGITIEPVTGKVRWEVPQEQAAAAYDVPLELIVRKDGKSRVIAAMKLVAIVEAGVPRYSFPVREPMLFVPGESVALRIQAAPVPNADAGLEYRLGSGQRPRMMLDSVSGTFTWVPELEDSGRHVVSLELVDSKAATVLATGAMELLVRPMLRLAEFPQQSAVAGQPFRLQLMNKRPEIPGGEVRFLIREGAPAGVSIDLEKALLIWNVPEDAAGRYEIRVALESRIANLPVSKDALPETLIVVDVAEAMATPLVPPQEEIDAAREELKELFKRQLAAAKAPADRALLADQLLQRADEQTAGASDFAMLDLVAEVAEKARATDVTFEVNRLRAARYGTAEIPAGLELIKSFRPNSLSASQLDSLLENLLRLALAAATEKHYADASGLLSPAEQVLRKQDAGVLSKRLADDITAARKLAEELAGDGAIAAELKAGELIALLQRWQFRPMFGDANNFNYVASGQTLADSGRSLWTFEPRRIRMSTNQQPGNVGILDPSLESGRYLIRMKLSAETTSAMLILGAGREQNLVAHLLTLEGSEFGRTISVPDGKIVINAATGITVQASRWNAVEVLVDGTAVAVRLNGTPVMSSQIPTLKPGRLGLLVPLERASSPRLELRDARILILPDDSGA